MLYEGENNHLQFGWDFGNIILFQSDEYDSPTDAMEAFNKFELPDKPWFAYMRVIDPATDQ